MNHRKTLFALLLLPCIALGEPAAPVDKEDEKLPFAFSQADTKKKVIALTFMAGPHPKHTPALLDDLEERDIKATFFVLGSSVDRYPAIVARMVKNGHEIGNLSMTHRNITKLSDDELLEELQACHAAISQASGEKPRLMRPPYGAMNPLQMALAKRKLGYDVVLWSIDSSDWKRPAPEVTIDRVLRNAHPGGIVALHDLHKTTVEAVPGIIAGLIGKDYKLVTVGELIDLDAKGEE